MKMVNLFGPYTKWIIAFLIIFVLLILLMPVESRTV